MMTERNNYGKKIDYDPLWQGPLQKKRSVTDFFCLVFLAIFLVIWLIVAILAFSIGNLNNLLPPTDSEGRRCGVDVGVKEHPYLMFFDITKCYNSTCSTTQVCLPECPNTNFLYRKDGSQDVKSVIPKLVCEQDVDVHSIDSWDMIDKYVKQEKCAKLYLESKSIFKRCVPRRIPDEFKNQIPDEILAQLETFLNVQVAKENLLSNALQGFANVKFKLIGFTLLAAAFSIIYLFTLRWFTKFFVYFSIFLVCVLIFFLICRAAMAYSSDKNKTDALAGLIISVLIFVMVILFTILFWRKINVACEVIKESCKAALCLPSTIIFSILPLLLYVIVASIGVAVTFYLSTIEEETFKVKMTNDGCNCPSSLHYDDGALCDPNIFMKECKITANTRCFKSGCRFFNSTVPSHVVAMQSINGFGLLWLISFIATFGHMVLAGTFAVWYWTSNKNLVPKFALLSVVGMTVRYHCGSLALGSLILTIARVISSIVHSLKRKSGDRNTVLEIVSCIVDALESALKFLTRYTYIMVVIHGQNFIASAKDAFNLLMRNIFNVFVINKITDCVLFFGIFLITGLTTTCTWLSCDSYSNEDAINDTKSTEIFILLMVTGVTSFFVAYIVVDVLRTAIDTIFICFLEDLERNDGSEQKPYFMSFKLRELLQK